MDGDIKLYIDVEKEIIKINESYINITAILKNIANEKIEITEGFAEGYNTVFYLTIPINVTFNAIGNDEKKIFDKITLNPNQDINYHLNIKDLSFYTEEIGNMEYLQWNQTGIYSLKLFYSLPIYSNLIYFNITK